MHGRQSHYFPCGTRFDRRETMDHICEHCDEIMVGNAYRVTSEENGITLLDMIVCAVCAAEAKRLQLHIREITQENIETLSRAHSSRLCA